MAGFVTDRPGMWVEAFLNYEKQLNRQCRYEHTPNETGTAWTEFKILIKYLETKVTVTIKMTTGYVTIKGADFQNWINSEFNLVK